MEFCTWAAFDSEHVALTFSVIAELHDHASGLKPYLLVDSEEKFRR